MEDYGWVVWVPILLFVVFPLLFRCIRQINAYEKGLLFTMGKYTKTL